MIRDEDSRATSRRDPLQFALVDALHSTRPAHAWNELRDLVCERVRIMRLAGESKVTVIAMLTGIARGALGSNARGGELEEIAEDLIVEVALWCIDEQE